MSEPEPSGRIVESEFTKVDASSALARGATSPKKGRIERFISGMSETVLGKSVKGDT